MNIVDAVIIILFILGILGGMRRGVIREVVFLIGVIICLILAFNFRTILSNLMYSYLPFFDFGGVFKGVPIINILLYETLAFLIVFALFYLILRIIVKITGIIEWLLKLTVVLGFISKILGAIVGFIEAYILIFIFLFVFTQPFINIPYMNESKVANHILDSTPIMSESIKNTRTAVKEVYILSKKYNSSEFNEEAIKLFVKYEIITQENVNKLRKKGKI